MSPILVCLVFVVLSFYLYKFMIWRPKDYPPGPIRWPIFGSILPLYWENFTLPYMAVTRWVKEYGTPMISMHMGNNPHVYVNDPDAIREVMTKPEFQGRCGGLVAELRSLHKDKVLGIVFTDGEGWSEQKRFALRNFRDLGYGCRKDSFEMILQEETQKLITIINEGNSIVCKDGIAKVPDIFYMFQLNMILNVFNGERFSLSQLPEAVSFLEDAFLFLKYNDPCGGAFNFLRWLQYLFPSRNGIQDIIETSTSFNNFFLDMVEKSKLRSSDEPSRGYIDAFLEKLRNGEKNHPSFNEENLIMVLVDFWFPAVTTNTVAHSFLFAYLLHYPEVQTKIQEEVDRVVGRSRLPTLHDRKTMPYTEATIRETLRFNPIAPMAPAHRCTKAAKLGDYWIPENTLVVPNLYNFHRDEKLWKNPNVFDPTRFLDADGDIIKKDPSLPFGIGKRVCPGETFSRYNLFVSTASFFQHFSIENPPGAPLPSLTDLRPGFNPSPQPFKVKIVKREF